MHRGRRGDGAGRRDALILAALLPGPAEAAVFALAVLVLNATPGVDMLLTLSRTLQGGVRAGVAAAAGINAGCVLHALAAAFGLAALLAVHPGALALVQALGAAYLAWLGLRLLHQAWGSARAGAPAVPAGCAADRQGAWADFRSGLLTNVLNPKVALFFLAFLPQFVPAGTPSQTASFLLLGGWFVLQSALFMLLLVALAAQLARWRRVPGADRALQAGGGLLFLALALRLWRDRPVFA